MCTLEIESFGYTMSDLKFRWEDGPKSVQASEISPFLDLTVFLGKFYMIQTFEGY